MDHSNRLKERGRKKHMVSKTSAKKKRTPRRKFRMGKKVARGNDLDPPNDIGNARKGTDTDHVRRDENGLPIGSSGGTGK